jgi:hypothetical protein
MKGFPTAAENLLHWEAVELHSRNLHAGDWLACGESVCREAREALGIEDRDGR